MNSLDTYTEQDVLDWVGEPAFEKAHAYLHTVTQLTQNGDALNARVRGTRPEPYTVVLKIQPDHWEQEALVSRCTCPVSRHCKHVAATLLVWIRERKMAPSGEPRKTVLNWIESFRQAPAVKTSAARPTPYELRYVLRYLSRSHQHVITLHKVKLDLQGTIRQAEPWSSIERALLTPPAFMKTTDIDILKIALTYTPEVWNYPDAFPLSGQHANTLFELLIDTGRLHYETLEHVPLHHGNARKGELGWVDQNGLRRTTLLTGNPTDQTLPLNPPWYIDTRMQETGPITVMQHASHVARLLALPPLTPTEAILVAQAIADTAPELPMPVRPGAPPLMLAPPPIPALSFATLPINGIQFGTYPSYGVRQLDYARLAFRYGPVTITPEETATYHLLADGHVAHLQRNLIQESEYLTRLGAFGLHPIPPEQITPGTVPLPTQLFGLHNETAWPGLIAALPELVAEGWEIDLPADFRHNARDIEQLLLDVEDEGQGWLSVSPGIEIEGRRIALAPLLAQVFENDGRWLTGAIEHIDDQELVILYHEELGRLRLPAKRLKPLVRTLVDLFGQRDPALRISALDAPRLHALDLPGRGRDTLHALTERLNQLQAVTPVKQPTGFTLPLRPYQLEGLAWLQYLARHQLAGILADDMGLGKTAQTLAHLLAEKRAGRLKKPALVILPTSLVFNWEAEAARFTPGLKLLSLHGTDRHQRFMQLEECQTSPRKRVDLAITTYPLLWRDAEALSRQEWSTLILDEAQTVKNAASKGAQVIRHLRAQHRIGLTGTPLENHLGELWTQFDFLLPGFLGDHRYFTRVWRTPIEKEGNRERQALLAARIRPFILRRRKEDVAKELPPKTIIIRTVTLEGGQRDLYETVRAAMDERVRGEIMSRGYARSQIVILDALLKLRQVCCDPRLLKHTAAVKVKERAKLDLLMSMLTDLIAEGRRILVFSQFAQMLGLIAQELDEAGISWVILTGETYDRKAPVEDFQKGRASVFLISLKAGGVGLNLTAADTVIHYDPWWNPAAENQATDRAHRIGQTKPVFVFKLICAGSIEERILALQDKKAALAASILSEDSSALAKFDETDIAALLAPLPPETV